MKLKLPFVLFAAMLLALTACEPKVEYIYYSDAQNAKLGALALPVDQHQSLDYSVELPKHLTSMGLFTRPIDGNKARLGRVIFYDKALSSDGKVSCASCHHQDHAFADKTVLSKGVNDRASARNSIALSSVVNFSAYYGTDINGPSAIRFFWDNSAETVEQQSRGAFTNPNEMNLHMNDVVKIIKSKEYYEPLFQKAYNADGEDDVTKPNVDEKMIFECVSHFINSMGSYKSKFDTEADKLFTDGFSFGVDKIKSSGPFVGFSASENAGKAIYMANCASCHSSNMGRPVLNFANNGLDMQYTDKGVGGFSKNQSELYQFKVPTLRNIQNSAPYMHDGRFATLEDVVEHYSSGVQDHPSLSNQLKSAGKPKNLQLTTTQKADLIAFLNTLTDETVQADERYANPFK
jgi:cytochrome c peroxidase